MRPWRKKNAARSKGYWFVSPSKPAIPRRRGSFNLWNSPPFPPFPAQGPPILRVPEPLKAAPGASYGDPPGRLIHRSL